MILPSIWTALLVVCCACPSDNRITLADVSIGGTIGSALVAFANTTISTVGSVFWATSVYSPTTHYTDGVIGLGNYQSLPNIFRVAYASGQISSPAFALQRSANNSALYFDGIPEK